MIKKIYELNEYLLITAIFIISNHEKSGGFFVKKNLNVINIQFFLLSNLN